MCGITGIVLSNKRKKEELANVSRSVYCMLQRGPDAEGIVYHEHAAFGHRRLKIIDLSDKASQPMQDPGGRYTLVFNGEIFNYRELRAELEKTGVRFRSESDTEVLLHLLIREGKGCLHKLDGEFAFGFYDSRQDQLLLVRDRYGVKPLYYYQDENKFVFSSGLNGIMAYGIPRELDHASLHLFFHLHYIPSPHTMLVSVSRLEAGSMLTVQNGQVDKEYYYLLHRDSKCLYHYAEAKQELFRLLDHSVQQRMIADVPLGCFLSGGLDSSIISSLASRHTQKLKTFSIGFRDEKYFDETAYATLVANAIGSDHHVFELSNNDLLEELEHMLQHLDEPFADSSALAVYILSKRTRKEVAVALSGDGADEVFGGYRKHQAELRALEGGLANAVARVSGSLLGKLPSSRSTAAGNKMRQLKKFAEGLGMEPAYRYWRWAGFTGGDDLQRLLGPVPKEIGAYRGRMSSFTKAINGTMRSVLHTDIKMVLEGDMLVKTDRMSMANSLEVRVPFLDHRLVDLVHGLPDEFRLKKGNGKRILRDTFAHLLPSEILSRKKQGFEIPLLSWLRKELKSMIENELDEKFLKQQGLFNPEEVKRLTGRLFSNDPGDSPARLWALLIFQRWWKKYMSSQR